MNLLKWSKRPAADVDATRPEVNILRGLIARATTPLLPDDYLHLINPCGVPATCAAVSRTW